MEMMGRLMEVIRMEVSTFESERVIIWMEIMLKLKLMLKVI